MKVFKLFASLLGVFAIVFGNTACKKDKNECCSYTYLGTTETLCEDDEAEWSAYFDNWAEVKTFVEAFGGDCD